MGGRLNQKKIHGPNWPGYPLKGNKLGFKGIWTKIHLKKRGPKKFLKLKPFKSEAQIKPKKLPKASWDIYFQGFSLQIIFGFPFKKNREGGNFTCHRLRGTVRWENFLISNIL